MYEILSFRLYDKMFYSMKVELLNTCRSEFDALDPYLKESIEKLKKYGFQFEILPSYASAQLRAQQLNLGGWVD